MDPIAEASIVKECPAEVPLHCPTVRATHCLVICKALASATSAQAVSRSGKRPIARPAVLQVTLYDNRGRLVVTASTKRGPSPTLGVPLISVAQTPAIQLRHLIKTGLLRGHGRAEDGGPLHAPGGRSAALSPCCRREGGYGRAAAICH